MTELHKCFPIYLPTPHTAIKYSGFIPHLYVLHSDFLNIHFLNYGLFLFIYLFILFLAALGLRGWLQAFSRFAKRGLLSVMVPGLPVAVASLVERRL